MKKTKVNFKNPDKGVTKNRGKHPCGICHLGIVNIGFIIAALVSNVAWVTQSTLFEKYRKMAMQINFQGQVVSASVGNDELEVAHSFCYLGDVTYIRCARKNFYELIPESCHTSLSFKQRAHIWQWYMHQKVLLYDYETWTGKVKDMSWIARNVYEMLSWISIGETAYTSMTHLWSLLNL